MAYAKTRADRGRSGRGTSLSGAVALVVAAFALATGVAACIAGVDPLALVSASASPNNAGAPSFDDRFPVGSTADLVSADVTRRSLVRSLSSEIETRFQQAKGHLAEKLQSQDWRGSLFDEPAPSNVASLPAASLPAASLPVAEPSTPSSVAAVPVPRSRPVEANLDPKNAIPGVSAPPTQAANAQAANTQTENRSLLQKLSDLLPSRVTLASLAPDGGLFRQGPDLTALGYDGTTAVYDISARAVYLPDGTKLEAHSGIGDLMDDPEHVDARNIGATPPNQYDLKPRERLFHGVQALRMIPVADNDTNGGRSGLLVHSYMLGPRGESNGCVSIRSYDKFLNAFTKGDVKRLVVVPSLDAASASQRSTSQS
jgi:Protein of unknown function (DUF2778)